MFTGRAVPGFMQGWSKRAYIRPEIQNQLADLRAPLGPPTFDYGVSESHSGAIDHNAVRAVSCLTPWVSTSKQGFPNGWALCSRGP